MERDVSLVERHLLDIAARAAGLSHDAGFGGYRDTRPRPPSWGADSDTRYALALARDVQLAAIAEVWDRVLEGCPDVMDDYERRLRCLSCLTQAWAELHRHAA